MNKRQKEVLEASLTDEKAVMQVLEKNYTTALADVKRNIKELQANPLTQSKAYQLEFQKQLEKQLTGVIDNLQGKNFTSIADYLNTCYNQGFLGTMYDLQGQGVPLVLPIDQKQVLKAVQKTGDNIKLANKLGVSTKELKKQVLAELQRGLATELSYTDIARNISNWGQADMNRSMLIARTEGHRVQNQAKMDSLHSAKQKGADVVKQWDSTLDGATRETHQQLDGQIRELDEDFEVEGMSAPFPGGFGDPAEDCNCRCTMLQRARWAVKDKTSYQKWNNETGGIIETTGYEDFKEKYLQISEEDAKLYKNNNIEHSETYKNLQNSLDKLGVEYNPVAMYDVHPTDEEIINALAGGDKTSGSCASLGLAYVGQKQEMKVFDFRGGESQNFFSMKWTLDQITTFVPEDKVIKAVARSYVTSGNRILKQVEAGKEYYFYCGRHASIVRKTNEGKLQYLELQSSINNGWTNFNGNVRYTLVDRFGCLPTAGRDVSGVMIDVEAFKDSEDFKSILGYINTASDKQKKGVDGYAK